MPKVAGHSFRRIDIKANMPTAHSLAGPSNTELENSDEIFYEAITSIKRGIEHPLISDFSRARFNQMLESVEVVSDEQFETQAKTAEYFPRSTPDDIVIYSNTLYVPKSINKEKDKIIIKESFANSVDSSSLALAILKPLAASAHGEYKKLLGPFNQDEIEFLNEKKYELFGNPDLVDPFEIKGYVRGFSIQYEELSSGIRFPVNDEYKLREIARISILSTLLTIAYLGGQHATDKEGNNINPSAQFDIGWALIKNNPDRYSSQLLTLPFIDTYIADDMNQVIGEESIYKTVKYLIERLTLQDYDSFMNAMKRDATKAMFWELAHQLTATA